MKKLFTLLCLLMIMGAQSMAQKFALVDMEYILKNIPAYERASRAVEPGFPKKAGRVDSIDGRGSKPYIRLSE